MSLLKIALAGALVMSCGKKKDDDVAADCFTTDITPVYNKNCAGCHATRTDKWYTTKALFLASKAKTFVAATDSTVMPPAGNTALTAAEKTAFAACK